jgi:hypothetical protein
MAAACPQRTPNEILSERMTFLGRAMLVVFLVGWVAWFAPFDNLLDLRGTPWGADYSMFYVAGRVVLEGAGERLYDQAEHQQRLHALFPGIEPSFCLPYRYPPFVAVLMAPLAALPYPLSFAGFLLLSGCAWAGSLRLLVGQLEILRSSWRQPILWALVGCPLAWETFIGGQASMFAILIVCGGFALVRARRWALAGAVLALAAYKPNVLAFVALGITIRHPRVLRGAIPVAGLVGLLSLVPGGWQGWSDYLALGSQLAVQPWDVATPYWKVHGVTSWLTLLAGENARMCSLAIGAALTVLFVSFWRRYESEDVAATSLAWAALISLNALFNPYTPIYDLSLLMVSGVLTAEGCARRYGLNVAGRTGFAHALLAILYFGPHLSQAISQASGLQVFPLVLLGISYWQLRNFFRHESAGHGYQPERASARFPRKTVS